MGEKPWEEPSDTEADLLFTPEQWMLQTMHLKMADSKGRV